MPQVDQQPHPAGDSDPGAVLDRLAATFGEAPIRDMAERFAAMLTEALAGLEAGDGHAMAHRIGGLAGTLGFAAAGRAWLAIDEGDDHMRPVAARESRQALAAIAAWQANRISSATSV